MDSLVDFECLFDRCSDYTKSLRNNNSGTAIKNAFLTEA